MAVLCSHKKKTSVSYRLQTNRKIQNKHRKELNAEKKLTANQVHSHSKKRTPISHQLKWVSGLSILSRMIHTVIWKKQKIFGEIFRSAFCFVSSHSFFAYLINEDDCKRCHRCCCCIFCNFVFHCCRLSFFWYSRKTKIEISLVL